jgi:hypothetical protein
LNFAFLKALQRVFHPRERFDVAIHQLAAEIVTEAQAFLHLVVAMPQQIARAAQFIEPQLELREHLAGFVAGVMFGKVWHLLALNCG